MTAIIYLWDMDSSNVVEIPALLSNKISRRYIFVTDGITIEKALQLFSQDFIPAENINAFRYQVKRLRGYAFYIGRMYLIEIADFKNKRTLQINLTSYYGIRRKNYSKAYGEILKQLWSNYFVNMYNYYADLYKIQQPFELAGIKFDAEGICWNKNTRLLWAEVALSNYRTYFMVHHFENLKIHKSCNYGGDWNAFILNCLLKYIIYHQTKNHSV